MKLYIIGNGFDLYHSLKTSFKDFRTFMMLKDNSIIRNWEEIISIELDENWSNIEQSFEYVDYDELVNKCSYYLKGYNDYNWRDTFHHDYEYEINRYLRLAINSREYLREWLDNTDLITKSKLKLDKDSIFLSFNYTNLLEECYGISSDKICHIHGSYINNDMVLGHNNFEVNKQYFEIDNEDTDVRIIGGNIIMNKSNKNSFKNSNKYIEENKEFFDKIADVTEIIVIGHSSNALRSVDRNYYEKIRTILKNDEIKVKVIYYKDNIDIYKEELNSLGFKNIQFFNYSYIEK